MAGEEARRDAGTVLLGLEDQFHDVGFIPDARVAPSVIERISRSRGVDFGKRRTAIVAGENGAIQQVEQVRLVGLHPAGDGETVDQGALATAAVELQAVQHLEAGSVVAVGAVGVGSQFHRGVRTVGLGHVGLELPEGTEDRLADVAGSLAATRMEASRLARVENERAWMRLRSKLFEEGGRVFRMGALLRVQAPSAELPAPTSLMKKVIEDLSAYDAVLQLPDLYRGLAARLVADDLHLRPAADLVNALTSHKDLIALTPSESYGFERWTSKANLDEELEVVRIAARLRDYFFPRATLSQEQRRAFPWTMRQWQAAETLANMERLIVLTGPPGAGKTKVILPITDPYVVHHGALGSFATVYAYGPAVKEIMAVVASQPGVDVVLDKAEGCARFELPEDRMGDLIVVSGGPKGSKVLGTSRDKHDLSGLNEPLRSHGGLTEQEIPLIANCKFKNAPAALRNFDAFALGCNNIVEA